MKAVPSQEIYINGVRTLVPAIPEIAVRETIANALIHQDFLISGASPLIEIYQDRIEIINPGNSLIEIDRIIDERRSRNEGLASSMRQLRLCEERGGGLDKALLAIESLKLPAIAFEPSEHSMRVVLFAPKKFEELTKEEKHRACFYHCIIRWIERDYMSNASLRERFSLRPEDYQAISALIAEMIKRGRIVPADPNQSNRLAKYVPYWVRPAP
jgi:predicted HTH transcriptional regulator